MKKSSKEIHTFNTVKIILEIDSYNGKITLEMLGNFSAMFIGLENIENISVNTYHLLGK